MEMNALAAIALGLTMLTAACTTATPSDPQILDVRGVWIGDWEFEPASAGRGIFTMTLTQNGTDVAGAVQLTGLDRTRPTTVTGVLRGDEIHLVGMASTGILKVSGNEMTGTLHSDGQPARVIARRQSD
jgi:hypothetical protein